MKILCEAEIPYDLDRIILEPNVRVVSYRSGDDRALVKQLIANQFDALISRRALSSDQVRHWSDARQRCVYLLTDDTRACSGSDRKIRRLIVPEGTALEFLMSGLKLLEAESTNKNYRRHRLNASLKPASKSRDVVLIGGGIVNLVTAHRLIEAGYSVRLFDAGPGPGSHRWKTAGCTHGGDDARMFTLSEMDNYNSRHAEPVMNAAFRTDLAHGGWAIHAADSLSCDENEWITDYERVSPWRANTYVDDVFSFTRESYGYWKRWFKNDPELFRTSGYRSGIVRIYSDPKSFEADLERHHRIRSAESQLSPAGVAQDQPALATAVNRGLIAGGIRVVGFTVNVHKFCNTLLKRLQSRGAQIHWNCRADAIEWRNPLAPAAIRIGKERVTATNVVVSPGVYGRRILAGTRCEGKLHGVLGTWLRLPNVAPILRNSLKLVRAGHIVEDANVTIATGPRHDRHLIIGSGYGYVGVDPDNIDPDLILQMYAGVHDTAAKYFPTAYQAAQNRNMFPSEMKYCVRPWTATGLGLFDVLQSSKGGRYVITGGHNTGGFAQAPAIANAVLMALSGQYHPMHRAYDPDRPAAFVAIDDGVQIQANAALGTS